MNIVLIGKSGSGKSEIQKDLTEYLRYEKIITYTTRAPRNNEKDGVDYNFVSKQQFDSMDLVLKTYFNGNMYGVSRKELQNSKYGVIVVDEDGLYELKNEKYFNFISFYIKSSFFNRLYRCVKRGDKFSSIVSRFIQENDSILTKCDFVCENDSNNAWDAVMCILKDIKTYVSRG